MAEKDTEGPAEGGADPQTAPPRARSDGSSQGPLTLVSPSGSGEPEEPVPEQAAEAPPMVPQDEAGGGRDTALAGHSGAEAATQAESGASLPAGAEKFPQEPTIQSLENWPVPAEPELDPQEGTSETAAQPSDPQATVEPAASEPEWIDTPLLEPTVVVEHDAEGLSPQSASETRVEEPEHGADTLYPASVQSGDDPRAAGAESFHTLPYDTHELVEPVPRPADLPATETVEALAPAVQTGAEGLPPLSDFERRKADAIRLLKRGARYAAYGAAGYLALVLLLILAYRFVNPPGSTLMLFRFLSGTSIEQTWVPIERISSNLVRAVVVAEDARFCDHWGIDFEAIKEAIRRSGEGTPRGASTISMQVTKNLFLWPSKSYLRKVIELPLTALIELVWPKRRILEIYLNVAEWGPGIFGAEAAARHHFRRPAARLGEREAALLAASLPNPVRRTAGDPGPQTSRKARVIQARMHVSGPVTACVARSQ